MQSIEAVDLFCGVGGLTAGLIKSGINVKAGYDIESDCRYAYEFNNKAKFI
ncbi:DNA cytosine methyltransferase, partial [Acinetobacter baumannii]